MSCCDSQKFENPDTANTIRGEGKRQLPLWFTISSITTEITLLLCFNSSCFCPVDVGSHYDMLYKLASTCCLINVIAVSMWFKLGSESECLVLMWVCYANVSVFRRHCIIFQHELVLCFTLLKMQGKGSLICISRFLMDFTTVGKKSDWLTFWAYLIY